MVTINVKKIDVKNVDQFIILVIYGFLEQTECKIQRDRIVIIIVEAAIHSNPNTKDHGIINGQGSRPRAPPPAPPPPPGRRPTWEKREK